MSAYLDELNAVLSNTPFPDPSRAGQQYQVALEYVYTVCSSDGEGPVPAIEVSRSLDFQVHRDEETDTLHWVCTTPLIVGEGA